ncbi:YD repeat-containing protein [Lutibacter oricola]|uniref:YD repeat-containing protein n=1 Tax=Lutibacter oricola TaxID=762486 RepID=A0A1H2VZV7_9FLAO|nr:hypothetical protein [Lutibacter oricola]SDW73811.1 YD repeat-containing protein [Lutibacter oricola]
MRKIYSILCLFVAVVAVSCSSDDDDVLSTLNSIDAFEINFEGLTADDVTYDLGNTITISVPFQTSLENLVATIGVSENATVSPASGAAVTYVDGEPTLFTVTAQDGESTKVYNVIINVRGEVGSGSRIETYTVADAWGENSVTTYTYAASNFVSETSKEEDDWGTMITTVTAFIYNDKNQVIETKVEADAKSTVYEYNADGQIIAGVYKIDDVLTHTYTYTYNTNGDLTSEVRTDHTDSDATSEVLFTIENGNVLTENKYGSDYVATYDDKNNPFKGVYPAAFAAIKVGVQSVNTNNPITGTIADADITYEYNADNYPLNSSYTYFDGAATVTKTFTYYAE